MTDSAIIRWTLVAGSLVLLTACGPKKPVFYPNAHLQSVGQHQAQADAEQCMADAEAYGAGNEAGKKVGGRTAKGAAIGAATSAVVSAVLGGNVGRAVGAGAAGGATAGAVGGAVDASDPDQLYKNYVERCLQEKGYDVIGWK